jgi:hypothetical protein
MSARLGDFLSMESLTALEAASLVVHEAHREIEAVPAPPAAPLPVIPFPVPDAQLKPLRLERLKIDRLNFSATMGEPCPTCGTILKYSTVVWPGGMRPQGMPESGWACSWCRQTYIYKEVE